jgi:hypothetical protein
MLLDEYEGGMQADSQWIGLVWLKISVLLFSECFSLNIIIISFSGEFVLQIQNFLFSEVFMHRI